MIKKNIGALILITALCTAANAQSPEEGLDRRVDVARDYTPDLNRAVKLAVPPDFSDTVSLRPDMEYSVKPSAWVTGFGVSAIRPARIDPSGYIPVHPLYVKAGGGWPGQSNADVYITTRGTGSVYAGFYGNHYGQYPDIRNDLGIDNRATMTNNRAGVFGRIAAGRYYFDADVSADYDIWSRYGQYRTGTVDPAAIRRSVMQSYLTPRVSVGAGNDFSDLSYFNFKVGGDFYHISDRFDNAELGLATSLRLGKSFAGHGIFIQGRYDYAGGKDRLEQYYSRIIKGGAAYELLTGRAKLAVAANLGYDDTSNGDSKFRFLPDAEFRVHLAGGAFSPFATLESGMSANSYLNITRINPYVSEDVVLPGATVEYVLKAGVSGGIGSAFYYSVFAGGRRWSNKPFFVTDYGASDSYFDIMTEERINAFTVGGELEGRISGAFSVLAGGQYYSYSAKEFEQVYDMPQFEAQLTLKYTNSKLSIGAGAIITGKRNFYERTAATGTSYNFFDREQKAVVDLRIDIEYLLNDHIGLFLEGRNLTGSKLYPFNHYPDIGQRITAGVKILY